MEVTFPHVGVGQRRESQPSVRPGPVRGSPGVQLAKADTVTQTAEQNGDCLALSILSLLFSWEG